MKTTVLYYDQMCLKQNLQLRKRKSTFILFFIQLLFTYIFYKDFFKSILVLQNFKKKINKRSIFLLNIIFQFSN